MIGTDGVSVPITISLLKAAGTEFIDSRPNESKKAAQSERPFLKSSGSAWIARLLLCFDLKFEILVSASGYFRCHRTFVVELFCDVVLFS